MQTQLSMSRDAAGRKAVNIKSLIERFALIVVWLLIIGIFGLVLPGIFLSWTNFSVLFATQAPGAVLALALVIPLTAGDYDLSVGAMLTLSAVTVGVLNAVHGVPIVFAVMVALCFGIILGLINAFFIVYVRIHSLVVTMGTTSIVTGLVQWMTNSSTIGGISRDLIDLVARGRLFGISYAFYYVIVIAFVIWLVFEFTPMGRRILFVGRGREVARLSGIDVGRVRVGCLVASAFLSAIAGVIYAGLLGAADPFSGLNFLLPAFAAAFLGATAIQPGRFNPWGAVVSVYFLATGITGLTMLGIPLWVTSAFNGGALILAVTVSQFARGRAESEIG
ncbi:ABC transporter permease [Puniceibacterium sediminis]|uniref:Monosaccharide ABC transporter membrane protein, CUT2 family n=1 Tax=Puniceibacterium sediminis TaxID=1608407 RepID=A0A238X3L5_9RHOB|nr:ABC transporter permease [Puniceibacterium sediminis]SNR53527.1 monosaccharide ABC transporter membrane protein, CUT2 family [Puniceibacterium sediminis]